MKKLILSIAVLTGLAFSSQAQTEKGKWILGGSASYESVKSDASNSKAVENFSIVPNVGYFISDNIALGTGLGYQYTNIGVASGALIAGQTEAFVVAPFGRVYVPIAEKFAFFGQAQVPLAFGTAKETDADGKSGDKIGNSTAIGVVLSPGFTYFPSKKIGIEFAFKGISYNNLKVEDANNNTVKGAGNDSFAIGTDFFAPQIGVQFYF
ncbi:outer membrane beta-barrel protein [Pedobacter arcticus]|uniref:outer membrane beta-barrel protein n=1 Tax=Pedobacter arcticus TaxID=752140 RepID=UPI0003179804|nr:outer membrane beta-barrel protein [Pedobacter arcticus]